MDAVFAEKWEAARYNDWYWISYAMMLVVPVLGSVLVSIFLRRRAWTRRAIHVLFALACAYLATESSFRAVSQKWAMRMAAATTPEHQQIVADRDGANLATAPLFCGAASLVLWAVVAAFCGLLVARPLSKDDTEPRRHRSFRLT